MIEVKQVKKFYGNGESRFQVLKGISLNIEDGDFSVILGASGSGKSTLLNVMSGLERPENGEVIYDGKDIAKFSDSQLTQFRKENVGFIFQQYYLLPHMNVAKNVKMGADLAENKDYKAIIQAVGLKDKLQKYPSELSGGEQQRVAIARALINRPKILLADEPTGNLDANNAWEIMKLLEEINERGTTVVVVTHNLEIVKVMQKRIITIQKGVIISDVNGGEHED